MKNIILVLCLFAAFGLQAQQDIYSRAKIKLSPEKSAFQLARLGFDISHGQYAPAKHFISEFSQDELENIRSAGFETEVLIADLKAHFLTQQPDDTAQLRDEDCFEDPVSPYDQYETPANYTYGSMGGYLTYAQMLDVLDDMAAQYPNLISTRAPLGTQTIDGNDIFWIRLSDNPTVDEETEPEVLYTALHHAREPNSMSQMIFFLWYMLENYDTDPEVQYLVDNVEMYFVPCVNVDGYLYNEETDPNGGGFWRKNRRENENGTFGVDLNRNYGYEWGINDTGSSPNPDNQTYRGTGPFSEPEAQAIKDFCEEHEFQIAHNYHAYGNLLIHPWGYDDSPTPDDALFKSMAVEMTKQNDFVYGTGVETVGYNVNGDSDDWMYGEETTKPKIYAYTPEVGANATGFWPNQGNIDPYNKSCMYLNLATANLVLNYGNAADLSPVFVEETTGDLDFSITRLGFVSGDLTVSLTPVSDNVTVNDAPQVFSLEQNEMVEGSFNYTLSEDINPGEEVVFILGVNNGAFTREETLTKTYFVSETIFTDDVANLDNWSSDDWATTTQEFFSAPSSITDSPNGNYSNNVQEFITLNDEIELGEGGVAFLNYQAKWDIENDYDYTQIEISVNDGNFIPMCGIYTNSGVGDQNSASGEPLYDGVQSDWVLEQIDLLPYLTTGDNSIKLRFSLVSDGGVRADGFYFDDVKIVVPGTVSRTIELGSELFSYSVSPNPATSFTTINFSELVENGEVAVFDILGKEIRREQISGINHRIETAKLAAGFYFYEVIIKGEKLPAEKFEVIK